MTILGRTDNCSDLTIILVAYRGEKWLPDCLATLLAAVRTADRPAPALGVLLAIDPAGIALGFANVGHEKWYSEDLAWVKQKPRVSRDLLLSC